jgi:hypothetical protein
MGKMALLLLLAASPALCEIRPDQALAPPIIGAAASNQEYARVASDGTNFFVVWRTRTASNTIIIGGGRLSPSGELLDSPSILMASGPAATLGLPDVVFVGGIFLVAYPSGASVVTRRFFRDGQPVDPQPVVIANCAMPVGLATNGRTVFLATAPNRFRLLATDGSPIGEEGVIPNAGTGPYSVASNGDRYLIAYASVFVLLGPTGDFVTVKPIPGGNAKVIATSNGSSFLIVWPAFGISCMSVDAVGNAGLRHDIAGVSATTVVAASRGNEYALFWEDVSVNYKGILGERVDAAGLPIDNAAVIVAPWVRLSSGGFRPPTVFASASNGRDSIVITGNTGYYNGNDWRTEAAIFSSLPQIDAEPANRRHAAIAGAAAEQASASIASNATTSLVAWRERSGNQTVIRAAFIDFNGKVGPSIKIGEASSQTPTATASNGRDFLISYIDPNFELVARRVPLEGVVDPKPIPLLPLRLEEDPFFPYQIAIGCNGPVYVVMMAGYEAIQFASVSSDTGLRSFLSAVLLGPLHLAESPAIQCGASGCTMTWRATFFPPIGETSNELTNALCFIDVYGRLLSKVDIAEGTTPALSMPPSEGKALFVYSSGKSMYAGRIASDGVVLDRPAFNGGVPLVTSATAFPLQPAAVVYNGLYFVEPDTATTGRLFWARIASEPKPRMDVLVDLHETVTLPVTLTASARNTYLVYSRGEADEKLVAPRLFLRTLASPDPQPWPVRKRAAR